MPRKPQPKSTVENKPVQKEKKPRAKKSDVVNDQPKPKRQLSAEHLEKMKAGLQRYLENKKQASKNSTPSE